jgi:hypothetical protein
MLDGHPHLAWNEEFEYAVDLMPAGGGFPRLAGFHRFLETDRVFLLSGHRVDRRLSYEQLVDSFLVQKRGAKPLVGATVHRHFDRLLRVWPDARFIHLVRDGRDVARSFVEMGWAGNAWAGCSLWIEAECLWERLSGELSPGRQLSVRFEALIANPVEVLTEICNFCGVAYDEAMMDYPTWSGYARPERRMVASWKRRMSPEDVRLCEARIGPMLQARGYELSVSPPPSIPPGLECWLGWQDYLGRTAARLRRYGPDLVLRDFVTRRLRLDGLQRRVRLLMNRVDNAHLA